MKSVSILVLSVIFSLSLIADELVIGVESIDYPPISTYSNGRYGSFSRELLDAFAAQYGHKVTYKAFEVKSLLGAFLAGQVAFKFPDNPAWAQDMKKGGSIFYSQPAFESIDGVMVPANNLGQGKNRLKRLGTIVGFTRSAYMADIDAGKITRHEHQNLAGLMKILQHGFVDGIYANVFVTRHFLTSSQYGAQFVVFDADLPHDVTGFSLSSIRHPKVINQFNEFLVQQADLLTSLKEKYQLK